LQNFPHQASVIAAFILLNAVYFQEICSVKPLLMRKIIVLSMISLDGVMQAPGGPEEDRSGGLNTAAGPNLMGMKFMVRWCRKN
jgi:hypothetical protein